MHDITVLDSVIGAGAMASTASSRQYNFHASYLYDSVFYGTTVSPDCPSDNQCTQGARNGITTSIQSVTHGPLGMEMHPKKDMHCPISS